MRDVEATWGLVLVDSAVWAAWSLVVGYVGHRLPLRRVERDTFITRIRRWERDGRRWRRFGVHRWKDRLPEAGSLFGGLSKRRLDRSVGLERFAAETRRAEYVHWAVLSGAPAFAAWNPPILTVAMLSYGLVANIPCIVVQRYNRARLGRIVRRRARP